MSCWRRSSARNVRSELDANHYEPAKQQHAERARPRCARAANVPLRPSRLPARRSRHRRDGSRLRRGVRHLTQARELLEARRRRRAGCSTTRVLTDLGGIYFSTGRFREALELNQQTIEAMDRNGRGGTLGRVTLTGQSRIAALPARRSAARAEPPDSKACGARGDARETAGDARGRRRLLHHA